ncbi:hypothetical protein FQN54_004841 [Arachnomyces sp. PD_36]|nr:hypothetical protein FQN54_004841 [Arachnomyces sp. PD_36]
MDQHNKSISSIAAKVREYHRQNTPFRIYHGSTNSTRHVSFAQGGVIDTSNLCHVLEVNREARTVLAEPNVPMDQLVNATLPHGLVPPVIMEFPGITVGGGFAGTAGESSSFEHGFFDRTVNWIEVVTADGEVVTASSSQEGEHGNVDLFHGAAGSLGTLGVITLLEIRLVDATDLVELTYHPISSVGEAIEKIQEETEGEKSRSNHYVDGIMFGLNHGVIITGRRTDTPRQDLQTQRFSRARDPWFYLHARKTLSQNPSTPTTELTPLTDYLFRYDRGAFWAGAYSFPYFLTPFNRITRFLLDKLMHTRVLYHAMHESGLASEFIIQDLRTPCHNAKEFIEFIDEKFGIYPLWLCPIRNQEGALMHPHVAGSSNTEKVNEKEDAMLLNVGVWGPYEFPRTPSTSTRREQFISANCSLERKLHGLGGMKWLYAQTYYTEEEFWQIYDRQEYDALRKKYGAVSLPSVFEKAVSGSAGGREESGWGWGLWERWPFAGIKGVVKTIVRTDYLRGRQ